MHILIANISDAYATQILIFERDFNEMSKIWIILIILFIFVIAYSYSTHSFHS